MVTHVAHFWRCSRAENDQTTSRIGDIVVDWDGVWAGEFGRDCRGMTAGESLNLNPASKRMIKEKLVQMPRSNRCLLETRHSKARCVNLAHSDTELANPIQAPPCFRVMYQVIKLTEVACGVGNVLQHKGGIGAFVRVDRTTFLFVAAHLAAHQVRNRRQ